MSVRSRVGSLIRDRGLVEGAARRAVALVPLPRRLGAEFRRFYAELEAAQWMSSAELRERQLRALRQTLDFAYAHSPFYRRLWDEHGVHPRDARTLEEFGARFPLVDRDALFHARDLTVPVRGMTRASTSGTTGTPFQFWIDPGSNARELAAIFHQWSRAGFRPGDTRVEMRGLQIRPIAELPDWGVVRFSVVNMHDHVDAMVRYLNRRRIRFIHGYPSAIAKFALLLRERGLRLDYPVQGVFFASEQVYDWQADAVTEVLAPATLLAHFGTAERVVLGAWCEHARAYHFLNPYGVVEFAPGGEIVGTSLINRATPFVRYRLTDVALEVDPAPCALCGRGYAPLVRRVGGRLEDFLRTERGEMVPPAVVTFPFKALRRIQATQIEQDERGDLLLRYVAAPSADAAGLGSERETLSSGLRTVLGQSVAVRFEEVPELPVTAAGKVKWIVSRARGAQMERENA
jgi:phenylacetate-coenzyme A ligase PaaK-like adenylate-forming protein